MREIKFRGKRIDNGKWVYGDLQHVGKKIFIYDVNCTGNIEIDPSTIGQYTGLKDKNIKEIYEGDILSLAGNQMTTDDTMGILPNGWHFDEGEIFTIKENTSLNCVTPGILNQLKEMEEMKAMMFGEAMWLKYMIHVQGLVSDGSCKIIGNIHDNKELLDNERS